MIEFVWIYALLALPLPFIFRYIFRISKPTSTAIKIPFAAELYQVAGRSESIQTGSHLIVRLLVIVSWILFIVAVARPQWVGEPIELPVKGRDLMMAVDLSGSMSTEDFAVDGDMVDRLTATKAVASGFIDRRIGDRIGLILFGRQAYLQAPLSFDRTTVKTFLDESAIGLAGKETAIGNAIGLAVKRIRKINARDKILILLTDGANTAGEVEPLKAAELAAEEGLKIYTIGIGADEMIVRSFFGSRRVNPSADLDEKTLTAIADKTGGRYFRARDTSQLEEIYRLIDELEPVEREKRLYRPIRDLFHLPLSVSTAIIVLLIIGHILSGGLRRKGFIGGLNGQDNESKTGGSN